MSASRASSGGRNRNLRSAKNKRGASASAGTNEPTRREVKYHGWHACLALWQQRPGDIIRIYISRTRMGEASKLLAWAAQQRLAYHVLSDDELARVTETARHQGICLLAREHPRMGVEKFIAETRGAPRTFALFLDGIGNPHNVGAIARSLAFFGGRHLLADETHRINFSASACRVAEGGAELIMPIDLSDPRHQLVALKNAGFAIAASDVRTGTELASFEFPAKTILILGNEETGVKPALAAIADARIKISGGGQLDSLNVSVAAALFSARYFAQHPAKPNA